MPSIALFIKELLSEDKFSSNYSDRIEERLVQLNAAQLQGMYHHLQATAKKSKSPMWRTANEELLHRIEGLLTKRLAEVETEKKILEDIRLKKKERIRKVKEEGLELQRVQAMIQANAHNQAKTEVHEEEQRRLGEERLSIIQRHFQAEECRNRWFLALTLSYIPAVIIVAVFVKEVIILAAILGGLTILVALLAYRAHLLTIIKPKQVSPSDIENQIAEREDILQKQAFMALKEKERRFEEQQRRDEEEARKRRAIKRERKRFEAALLAKQREDELAMAREIYERQRKAQEGESKGGTVVGDASSSSSSSMPMKMEDVEEEERKEESGTDDGVDPEMQDDSS
eukprot:gene7014-7758_t